MSGPSERTVAVGSGQCRVWEKGRGPVIAILPGYGGALAWTPFYEALAEQHRVVVLSLPGFIGGGEGHHELDTHLDWMLAVRQLIEGAGAAGGDLLGVGWGGALAADAAAIWGKALVRRLVLISPFGIFDDDHRTTNLWAQPATEIPKIVVSDPKKFAPLLERPKDVPDVEWKILTARTAEAAARFLWPLGDTGLAKRLPLITQPTLLVWGRDDRVIPFAYSEKFTSGISGPTQVVRVERAGHLADLDQPSEIAKLVSGFTA